MENADLSFDNFKSQFDDYGYENIDIFFEENSISNRQIFDQIDYMIKESKNYPKKFIKFISQYEWNVSYLSFTINFRIPLFSLYLLYNYKDICNIYLKNIDHDYLEKMILPLFNLRKVDLSKKLLEKLLQYYPYQSKLMEYLDQNTDISSTYREVIDIQRENNSENEGENGEQNGEGENEGKKYDEEEGGEDEEENEENNQLTVMPLPGYIIESEPFDDNDLDEQFLLSKFENDVVSFFAQNIEIFKDMLHKKHDHTSESVVRDIDDMIENDYDLMIKLYTLNNIEEIFNDQILFQAFGPWNPPMNIGSNLILPNQYRMFTFYLENIYEEPQFSKLWFNGSCDFCEIEIPCYHWAVRIPLPKGGWDGCYCSFTCMKKQIKKLISACDDEQQNYTPKQYRVMLKEIDNYEKGFLDFGIADREIN
jgi:hypothetical protein